MTLAQPAFMLTFRHCIWRVTFDGVFYGDYPSEADALDDIADAQRKLASVARVLRGPQDRS